MLFRSVVKNQAQSTRAIFELTRDGNKINNHFYLGLDSEFVNDCVETPYTAWSPNHQFINGGQPTHADYNGPFARYITVSAINGLSFLFDLAYFPTPPLALHKLLVSEPRSDVTFVLHSAGSDDTAYTLMYGNSERSYIDHQIGRAHV